MGSNLINHSVIIRLEQGTGYGTHIRVKESAHSLSPATSPGRKGWVQSIRSHSPWHTEGIFPRWENTLKYNSQFKAAYMASFLFFGM